MMGIAEDLRLELSGLDRGLGAGLRASGHGTRFQP